MTRRYLAPALALLLSAAAAPAIAGAGADKALPDLNVTAQVTNVSLQGGAAAPGDLLFYSFFIENKGKADATGATFTAQVPAGVTVIGFGDAFQPAAYMKVASVGYQMVFENVVDGFAQSTCTMTGGGAAATIITCRLGQMSGFFYPNLVDGVGVLSPSITNMVQFWVYAPATPGFTATSGVGLTSNGDARLGNNAASVVFEVK